MMRPYFEKARTILRNDNLPSTFREKLSLYRGARAGLIFWRCTFS
jgi:hypothetical protein